MISPEDWLAATTKSLTEVVDIYFDVGSMAAVQFDAGTGPKCGTLIGLVSQENAAQIMLIATRPGAEVLAKALLGFEPDEAIEIGDLADAIGEIVNIVAGMVKTVVNGDDSALNLTLPTFVEGTLEPISGQIVTHQILKMGPVETKVVIISGNRSAQRAPRTSAA